MKATLPRFPSLLLAGLVFAATGTTLTAATPFHFALARSAPADQATVARASQVKLWFTEPPSENTVSIRVIDAAGAAISTAAPMQDPEEASAFSVTVPDGLGAGSYRVSWRGMGDDGHVVRGEFAFTVVGG